MTGPIEITVRLGIFLRILLIMDKKRGQVEYLNPDNDPRNKSKNP